MTINLNQILGMCGLLGLCVSAFSENPLVRVLAYIGLLLNGWFWK